MVDGAVVRAVARECGGFLDGLVGADWSAVVPEVGWTVAATVAHVSDCLLYYSADLAAGPEGLRVAEVRVLPSSPPADLVRAVRTTAAVLAAVVEVRPPDALGWHPWGLSDAAGFAGMGCDEMLVHTHDAGRGLGAVFAPDPALPAAVLRRLFPDVPPGDDPMAALLWANGRVPLGGRPRREEWRWRCAPLDAAGSGS
ncbi:maleylpyruvate isomerase N-terminal domain-containing protein [Saccharothrix longispora]|uniref:maleylpyruvate isomerase N-terminal domain-containing protein n=1 Tax=Saccharothrix longispora TaxID=33920 RepID=UPI0028FD2D10|nr:maleylpyruvate isomerase N-terminal domain-containing protein [Saccharothrix longispora]MDU0289419.1 maleylpyruvate isomerase N-terminal domain-containing protein [Saccharothrix longispora]